MLATLFLTLATLFLMLAQQSNAVLSDQKRPRERRPSVSRRISTEPTDLQTSGDTPNIRHTCPMFRFQPML